MSIPPIRPYALPTAAELLPPAVDWRPDPRRCAVLIHDMQRYFVDFLPRGASPTTGLLETIGSLRTAGLPVIFSVQPGGMSRGERGLVHDFWGPGMSTDPAHRSVVAPLTPAAGDHVVTKYRYSAFFRTGLAQLMKDLGRDQLAVCGVFAHIGCLATAMDAFAHDIQPFLLADATADFTRADHLAALHHAARRCAVTMTTGTFLSALGRAPAARPAPPARLSPASGRSAAGGS
ncbi:isochorismatase family protein [Actinoplanes sp. N902-109]|uniref:isochorismatase family protein n=1 Tax=Actinoplanes sp. (strain N902-109) TaxID=649831 RepID=UPI0012F9B55C|nr:isochorismatase family protein [Actinoplanes sp. N902-109]